MRRMQGRALFGALAVAVSLTACVGAGTSAGSGSLGASGAAEGHSRVQRAAGPVPTAAPLTGGSGINLASGAALPTLPRDWVESEYSMTGTATGYRSAGPFSGDGRIALTAASTAPYTTRIVVRRPASPKDFNGTVVVEWLNVSGGLDAAPEYTYLADELIRQGYAWVGVSAQMIGVDGGPVAVTTPVSIAGGAGKGLRALDPARYGSLHHPGDAYAYDIFTQAGRLLRHPGKVDPLGSLRPRQLLAVGESQSAIMLTTYIDGVQPLEHEYDGFLLHSRGGAAAPLGSAGQGIDITQAILGPPVRIRTDVDVPVLMVETESDVVGPLGYLPAAQGDTTDIRTWEVAGTAHVDLYQLGPTAKALGCATPVNAGPAHFVVAAALSRLNSWAAGGKPPPTAPRFDLSNGQYVRSSDGIIEGGIRTPLVDVPVDVLSGSPAPKASLVCLLAGSTVPLPATTLARLYPSRHEYLKAFAKSTDAAIAAGFVLPADRKAMLAEAQPDRIPA